MREPVQLRDVEHDGRLVDVAVTDGVVRTITPTGRRAGVGGDVGAVVEGCGGAVIPGLHDHHLHLMALAARSTSTDLSAVTGDGPSSVAEALRDAARSLPPGAWLRAVGYHEPRHGPLDRWALDALVADRPARVQHRSGGLWILNTRALAEVGLLAGDRPEGCEVTADGTPTGRLFRLDRWLSGRIPRSQPDLAAVGRALLRHGVVGVTDATPFTTVDDMQPIIDATTTGALPQHVVVTGSPDIDPNDVPAPVSVGPAKILLSDHDLPTPDQIADDIRRARGHGRAVAVHCVTREALMVTLAALADTGVVPGDRIEHGAVVPPELRDELRRLGLTVVTQPNFVRERGDDYLAEVDADDVPYLWPAASLVEAGVAVAAGTDAPFGQPDPWALVAAATDRRTASGAVLGPTERLPADQALSLLLRPALAPDGPPRRVALGQLADLCVLAQPLAQALADPASVTVAAVLVAGRLHRIDATD